MKSPNLKMIREQIISRGITDWPVLWALARTDRALFVPADHLPSAYEDRPVPLFPGSTVSQPYIVALMTELLHVKPEHKVLEIGTGSGYQASVLSMLVDDVWTVEVLPELVQYAQDRIVKADRKNVHIVSADGWRGFPDAAPYDRIIVTAAPATVPSALIEQLAPGGRMILPVGTTKMQSLEIITKSASGEISRTTHSPVQFVPMVHGLERK